MNLKRSEVKSKFSLKEYSTIKIGGVTEKFFIVDDRDDLAQILKESGGDFYLLGGGSNLLINDGLIRKPVVKLGPQFCYIKKDGDLAEAGAGLTLSRVLNYALKNNLGGLQNLAGIPATVGGLLVMNASSFGVSIGDVLDKVEVMDKDGRIKFLAAGKINFSYRYSGLDGNILLRAWFRLIPAAGLKEEISTFLKRRWQTQDFSFPSCGCIFKNPAAGAAGRLIASCGLSGARKNEAQISPKHANFIINLGRAAYNDVDYLIQLAKDKVYRDKGIVLEEEICRWE